MRGGKWDKTYRTRPLNKIPWHSPQPDRRLVQLVNSGMVKPGRVLDLCSGDGTNSIYLASRGFTVTGVDISPTAVEIAQDRCQRRGQACTYRVGDVLSLRFGSSFDLIFDRGCFHHIPKRKKPHYVSNITRWLHPRGHFFLLCFSDKNPVHRKNLSREDIRRSFSREFDIIFIKNAVHREPNTGGKRYLFAAFMQKKAAPKENAVDGET